MSEVLVVTEVLSITSEKVNEMDESVVTNVSESAGEVEETVGAVVSVVVVVLSVVPVAEYSSLSSLQEIMVRLKQEIRIMNKTFFIFSSIQKVKTTGLYNPWEEEELQFFHRTSKCAGHIIICSN